MRTYKQQAAAVKKVTKRAIGPNHEQALRDATTSLLALEFMLGDKKAFKAELEKFITERFFIGSNQSFT